MNGENFHGCAAILFDFGGTLDSDGLHWLTRFFALYEGAGLVIPRPEIARAFYHAVDTCYADSSVASMGIRLLVGYHVRLQFEALGIEDRSKEREIAERFISDCESVFISRLSLLKRMERAYRLGVVSNFYGNLEIVLEEARLSELFDVVIDSNRVGVRKPDRKIFLLALTRLGLPANQVIFVGDSLERDVYPAADAGMKAIWLKGPDERPGQGVRQAEVWESITRLTDLEELLR